MTKYKKWESKFKPLPDKSYRFTCNRCGTKNTTASMHFLISSQEENIKKTIYETGNTFDKEEFDILECSTCGSYSIVYKYFKGHPKSITSGSKQVNSSPIKINYIDHELQSTTVFPEITNIDTVCKVVSQDYNLMHKCFLIGSSQGVAVHYRRILDKIFNEYEKKYLSEKEKEIKKIEKRANKISEKSPFFKSFNENIKDLKGIVSAIIHDDFEDLELSSELVIHQKDFDKLDRIILSLVKVYELEFKDFPAIKEKSKKVSEMKKNK